MQNEKKLSELTEIWNLRAPERNGSFPPRHKSSWEDLDGCFPPPSLSVRMDAPIVTADSIKPHIFQPATIRVLLSNTERGC